MRAFLWVSFTGCLARTVNHHGFAFHQYQALIFQGFKYAPNHFSRAAHNAANFLTGNFDLHAVWVSHSIWLFAQLKQCARYAAGYIQKGEVAYFACSGAQAARHLAAESE